MAAASDTTQTIAKLTPLADVLAWIVQEVKPVLPGTLETAAAVNRVLAADVVASARPAEATALVDGWAVRAESTLDAGGYAPALLPQVPQRIDAGEPMPTDADSVAPLDAVRISPNHAEALATINPGNGVLPVGGDCHPAVPLRRAGERLRAVDLAVFAVTGHAHVNVRAPRLRLMPLRGDAIVNEAAWVIAEDIRRHGGSVRLERSDGDLSTALAQESEDCIVTIGGTGSGRNDTSILTLARVGQLAMHGIALTPGETTAFGFAGTRPVLMLPGRLDAALSVWLVIGRLLLDQLAAAQARMTHGLADTMTLTRKVTSTVGLAELIPVRRRGDGVEPLASKYLPLSALSRADGWILIPAESEGYSAGSSVLVRPWP